MKQFKLILLSVLALTLGFSSRADERPISYDQLPQAAKAFLAQHFPDRTPLLVQADWEDYEVIYDNGEKVEFTKKGDWKKIDCRMSAVPDVLVPEQIKAQVNARYPGAVIIRLKKDRTGYVCMLLEALCGATYPEIVNDYMLTYDNYYGINEKTDPERYHTIKENNIDVMLGSLVEDEDVNITRADLSEYAKDYLIDCGLSRKVIKRLKVRLMQ